MGTQRQSQTRKTEGNSQPQGERSANYTPHPIEELQGLIGNRAMGRILQAQRMSQESEVSGDSALGGEIAPLSQGSIMRKPLFRGLSHELMGEKAQQGTLVQAKLMVGKANDRFEKEADRVAAEVVQQIDGQTPQPLSQGKTVQREEREEERLQRKPSVESLSVVEGGMAAPRELEASIQGARGSGQPLDESVKEPMERAFGADFSGVRVHTNAEADELNQLLSSRAFTTGENIFFRQGAYKPSSRGQELLAHELTHVVQQGGEEVKQKSTKDMSGNDNVKDEKKEKKARQSVKLNVSRNCLQASDANFLSIVSWVVIIGIILLLIVLCLCRSKKNKNRAGESADPYEPFKEKELWGKDLQSIEEASVKPNCYAYAWDVRVKGFDPGQYSKQGEWSDFDPDSKGNEDVEMGKNNETISKALKELTKRAELDGMKKIGNEMPSKIEIKEWKEKGYYLVAAAMTRTLMYHWYRYDYSSDTWSHKPSASFAVINVDGEQAIIYDPQKCSRQLFPQLNPSRYPKGFNENYSEFCGYFMTPVIGGLRDRIPEGVVLNKEKTT